MTSTRWKPLIKPFTHENSDVTCLETENHPLKEDFRTNLPAESHEQVQVKTINQLDEGEIDPLGLVMKETHVLEEEESLNEPQKELGLEILSEWKQQQQKMLQNFSSTTFRISARLFQDTEHDTETLATFRQTESQEESSFANKSKIRLRQLTSPPQETMEISEQDYSQRVQQLKKDLVTSWSINQRVLALRIAIKSFKLLSDNSAPSFYPSLFVLVSDTAHCFGQLVYDRIKEKSREIPKHPNLHDPQDLTSESISIAAKETCRNWFYKTSCIRELLPRIYMEMALLPCYDFLDKSQYPQIVSRLSSMIRGIGDPTIALYARAFLAFASVQVMPVDTPNPALLSALHDYMFTFREFHLYKMVEFLVHNKMSEKELLEVHSPAVQWLLKCIARTASYHDYIKIIDYYKELNGNSMVLAHIIEVFPATFLSKKALLIVSLIQVASASAIPKLKLYESLALKFVDSPPPQDQRLAFLNESWKKITMEEDLSLFIKTSVAYMKLLVCHFSAREVLILLKDIVRHLASDELESLHDLESLIQATVSTPMSTDNFRKIITSSHFNTILGMLKEDVIIRLSKTILDNYVVVSKATPCTNVTAIHALLEICRRVHDSIDQLTESREVEYIGSLICAFISSTNLDAEVCKTSTLRTNLHHLQQQFNVYIDCRAAFCQLDEVRECLIQSTVCLAMKAHSLHSTSSKIREFVKSCLAYCHITIPSIADCYTRLDLLILCSQVALRTASLPQMDGFVHASISMLTQLEVTSGVEERLKSTLQLLMGVLLYVPAAENTGPFYFIRAFMKGIRKIKWSSIRLAIELEISLIPYFGAAAQSKLDYRIPNVDSNDVLYGGDPEYAKELEEHFTDAIGDILEKISKLDASSSRAIGLQTELLLNLSNQMFLWVDFDPPTLELMQKLCHRIKRNCAKVEASPDTDSISITAYVKSTFQYVELHAKPPESDSEISSQPTTHQGFSFSKLATALCT